MMGNSSLREGGLPGTIQKGTGAPLLKRLSLDPTIQDYYHPLFHLSLLVKVVEKTIALQFQLILNEIDHLNPYKPGYGTRSCFWMTSDESGMG